MNITADGDLLVLTYADLRQGFLFFENLSALIDELQSVSFMECFLTLVVLHQLNYPLFAYFLLFL